MAHSKKHLSVPKCYQGQQQRGSDSISAAIYRSNLLPGEILLLSDWEFFGGIGKKMKIFWIGDRA